MTSSQDTARQHWTLHPLAIDESDVRVRQPDFSHASEPKLAETIQSVATGERPKTYFSLNLLENLTGRGYVSRYENCAHDLYLARFFFSAEEAETFRLHHMESPEEYAVCKLPEAGR